MQFHRTKDFSIFFGDSQHSYVPALHKGFSVLAKAPFNTLSRAMNVRQLVFLHQTHGYAGKVITAQDVQSSLPSFVHDGDYLITNVPRIGIGISTADCLPVMFYDPRQRAIGIAHAGWRGSVANIVAYTLERMKQTYGTKVHDVQVFFGPAAKTCCYEIKDDFLKNIAHYSYAEQLIEKKEDKIFFSNDKLNILQLENLGINQETINKQYHQCTICNHSYCSVRRNSNSSQRQMTVIALN